MSKTTVFNHAYLTVELDTPRPWPREDEDEAIHKEAWLSLANDVAEQIKRHCDGVARWGTRVEVDTEDLCEYCSADWIGDDDAYNDGCCSEDEEGRPEEDSA